MLKAKESAARVVNMDSDVVSAAITAITSVITCLIGVRAGERNSYSPPMKKIWNKQLNDLYTPMVSALDFEKTLPPTALVVRLQEISKEQYSLVPPLLSDELHRLHALGEATHDDLSDLVTMIHSFYNWTRRAVGHPFSKSKIKAEYTPTFERNGYIKLALLLTFSLLWSMSLFVSWAALAAQKIFISEGFTRLCFLVALVGLTVAVSNQQKGKDL